MATQAVQGRKGYLSLAFSSVAAAAEVAEITDYTLSLEQPDADATSFDSSGWDEHVMVGKTWDLAFSIVPTSASVGLAVTPTAEKWHGWINAQYGTRWLTLYPTTSATAKWVGRGVCTLMEVSGDMGDVMRADFAFMGHGAVTYTT